ncbi:MAG TPA: HAMP domain-containing sensor histidine kinase [Phototrophicaceae bacterium]|nr:HAMP domain-containing sensor histidine kinase [Phototrophicaceae bacterium]
MTGGDKHNQDDFSILRQVLHIIASGASPAQSIDTILESGRALTNAQGAACLLFNDPRFLCTSGIDEDGLPDDALLKNLATELPMGIHIKPAFPDSTQPAYTSWVIAQLRIQRQLVGVLWLVFDHAVTEIPPNMDILLDGLNIVAIDLRSQVRHEKVTRNQSEFIRIVSHDLRSPLTAMQGFASMLESGMVGSLNEKQLHFVERILSGISQMTSLVENIQDAGRYDPENGFYEMQRSHCDVIGIVDRITSNHLVPADKQELTISKDIADDIPIISADAHMLERAITNLVDNAIKYTPNGGKIVISVRRQDESIFIAIQDNGLGISPENQMKLFGRHQRIPREEHTKIKGSGLGLFIVRSVAQRHGGDAWVESVEGEGSTFIIRIPIITTSEHEG